MGIKFEKKGVNGGMRDGEFSNVRMFSFLERVVRLTAYRRIFRFTWS